MHLLIDFLQLDRFLFEQTAFIRCRTTNRLSFDADGFISQLHRLFDRLFGDLPIHAHSSSFDIPFAHLQFFLNDRHGRPY